MFRLRYILISLIISIIALTSLFYVLDIKFGSKKSTFTITQDTKIDPNSKLAKYVTQEEVDSFAFRCADIVCDNEKNTTLIPLREALDRRDTEFVVKFIKDNNLSVDVKMRDNRTPLMYSSFRNDVNTTNTLINLKADIRAKDRYGLTPMAYAIMLNSADTAKILFDQGVRFEEIEYVAYFIINSKESYERISSLIINDHSIEIKYAIDPDRPDLYPDTDINNPACVETCSSDKVEPFKYVSSKNLTQMAELMLSSGYKPKKFKSGNTMPGIGDMDESGNQKNKELIRSGWAFLVEYEDYKPMLDIFIKYDLPNSPTKEQLKEAYGECYNTYLWYKQRWIDGDNINKKRPFYVDMPIRHLEKYCIDTNGTFQDVREFFAWANKQNLLNQIIWISDTEKVIYKSKFDTIYNKVNIIDANSKKE